MYTAASLTFECGIIFHSIFIGITLGTIALCFHQTCKGMALGATLVKAEYSLLMYTILGLMFVLVTPIGVAIGIGSKWAVPTR